MKLNVEPLEPVQWLLLTLTIDWKLENVENETFALGCSLAVKTPDFVKMLQHEVKERVPILVLNHAGLKRINLLFDHGREIIRQAELRFIQLRHSLKRFCNLLGAQDKCPE